MANRTLGLPGLIVLAAALTTASAQADTMQRFCEVEWPDDYRMQRHCLERQVESFEVVGEWANTHLPGWRDATSDSAPEGESSKLLKDLLERGHRAVKIFVRCYSDWSEGDQGTDWRMTRHCIERQEESLRVLGKSLDGYDSR